MDQVFNQRSEFVLNPPPREWVGAIDHPAVIFVFDQFKGLDPHLVAVRWNLLFQGRLNLFPNYFHRDQIFQ